jgi:hypothetical protein
MQRFKVISPLDHDLVAYPIGAVIECDEALAAQLVAAGVIVRGDPAESAQEPPSALPVQPGGEDLAGTGAPAPAAATPSQADAAPSAAAPRRRASRNGA